jgi:YebC/PmpR family DNA-binding regulatory protein
MSGHSKWATTHRQKEVADAKRGAIFTKLANAITIAAKQGGGDLETNFKLRMAIDKARDSNMPKDNIERAVKKGTGELGGEQIEEIAYEAFGPAGTAFIIETVTSNRNRTVSNLKHIFNKYGGNLGGANSVAWMFERSGVIRIINEELKDKNIDELELKLIDLNAKDVKKETEGLVVYTDPLDLQKIKNEIEKNNINIASADIEYVPKDKIEIKDNVIKENLEKILDELESDEDANNYYFNFID